MPGRSAYTRPTGPALPTSFQALSVAFRRAQQAANKSPRTVQTYGEGLRLFGEFLVEQELPTEIEKIRREMLAAFSFTFTPV
jgi:hypothetical protein